MNDLEVKEFHTTDQTHFREKRPFEVTYADMHPRSCFCDMSCLCESVSTIYRHFHDPVNGTNETFPVQ